MWPFRKKRGSEEFISLLKQQTDEYYESLAFRLANYAGARLELRKYSTSSYRKHIELIEIGGQDRQWINLVTGPRTKAGYSVLISGRSCGIAANPFKAFLERACELLGSKVAVRWFGLPDAVAGCGSVAELDLRLTAIGA